MEDDEIGGRCRMLGGGGVTNVYKISFEDLDFILSSYLKQYTSSDWRSWDSYIFCNVYIKGLLKTVRLSDYEIFFTWFLLYYGILCLVNSVLKQGFPREAERPLSCFIDLHLHNHHHHDNATNNNTNVFNLLLRRQILGVLNLSAKTSYISHRRSSQ